MDGLPKILLVEDTVPIADIYSRVLTSKGYQLRTAGTVDEMLSVVVDYKPDLIFLDIMLPGGKTGLDALSILRNDPRYGAQKTKIVMLTNLGQNDEVQKMWEKYADGFVIKADIDPHELVDVIDSLDFGQQQSSQPSQPSLQPLEADASTQQAGEQPTVPATSSPQDI